MTSPQTTTPHTPSPPGAPAPAQEHTLAQPDAAELTELTQTGVDTGTGATRFAMRAVERLVMAAVQSVPGTAKVDSKLGGLATRGFPRVAVQLDAERKVAAVDLAIATVWPAPITQVATAVQAAVEEAVEAYLGYATTRVNVSVGATVPGARVDEFAVEARPRALAAIPTVRPSKVASPQTRSSSEHLRPTQLHRFSAHHADSLKPVSTRQTFTQHVASVTTPQPAEPQHPATPAPASVRHVEHLPLGEARTVSTPAATEPRHIAVPAPAEPRRIAVPGAQELRPVAAPPQKPLKPVTAPRDHEPRPVGAPPQKPLKPVTAKPFNPVHVYAPRPEPLRAIEINHFTAPQRFTAPKGARHE